MSKSFIVDIYSIDNVSQLQHLDSNTINFVNNSSAFVNVIKHNMDYTVLSQRTAASNHFILDTLFSPFAKTSEFDPIFNRFASYSTCKATQQIALKMYCGLKKYEEYYHLNVVSNLNPPDGDYVIKPNSGSSSHGVVLGISNSATSKSLSHFYGLMNAIDPKDENAHLKAKELIDRWGYKMLTLPRGQEEISLADLAKHRLIIQEANPFLDVIEYRVVKVMDKFLICLREGDRSVEWVDYQLLCYLDDQTRFTPSVAAEIQDFFENFPFLIFGSIDLWVSRDSSRWGVYEFQTQYGYSLIPAHQHDKLCEYLIASMIDGELKSFIKKVNDNWEKLTNS